MQFGDRTISFAHELTASESESSTYLLALGQADGLTPLAINKVVSSFPKPDDLLNASIVEFKQKFDDRICSTLQRLRDTWSQEWKRSERTIQLHLRAGIIPVALTDPRYPPLLRLIKDPPPVLFVKGDDSILCRALMLAVIGTRDPTVLGGKLARQISRNFAREGFLIVAGLAKGIDAEAHEGTVAAGGRTVAVLANSLDHVYPKENRPLADRILKTGGLLVSEYPLGTKTFRSAFVQRDRIQSGLSSGVIAVQTDIEGGTMHTVRFAEEQRRLVFCPRPLPEENDLKQYAGIKMLIQSQRAEPFSKADHARMVSKLVVRAGELLGPECKEFLDKFKRETLEPSSAEETTASDGLPSETKEDLAGKMVALLQVHRIVKKKDFDSLVSEARKKLFPPNRQSSKERKSEEPGLFSRD